ncbi:MAG: Fur family transcriptional regulator [Pseudomonadota bacterium]
MTDSSLVERARVEGIRLTSQRALVCTVLQKSKDHPNVDDLYARAREEDPTIAIATVYRTLKVLEDHKLIARHGFGQRKSRYELIHKDKHDHLIDIGSGKVMEFSDPALEKLINEIAARMGYNLERHQLELYGTPAKQKPKKTPARAAAR